jgi:hypothetical protein
MNQPFNPVETLAAQYKQGYKTSEFWVALAAGFGPAITAAFDPSKPVSDQLSHLTWIAVAYILARAGLKVARVSSQAKLASSATTAAAMSTPAPPVDTFAGDTNGGGLQALDTLVDLRERGLLTDDQYEELAAGVDMT